MSSITQAESSATDLMGSVRRRYLGRRLTYLASELAHSGNDAFSLSGTGLALIDDPHNIRL